LKKLAASRPKENARQRIREAFTPIGRRRRFVCTRCGGRAVNVLPDWRAHRAIGMGR